MDELKFSKLSIRSDNDYVTFIIHGNTESQVRIREDHIPDIIEFLRSKTDIESNRRVGSRVDVTSLGQSFRDRFKVYIDTPEGGRVDVTPINISLTGILVGTEKYVGHEVMFTSVGLSFGDINVLLPSIVVRSESNRMAFQFIASIKNGRLNPATELVAIF